MIDEYIYTLTDEFNRLSNEHLAKKQSAYLRDKFSCFGIKTPVRREIQKPFLRSPHLPDKRHLSEIIHVLWSKKEREYHYFGNDLAFRYVKNIEQDDIYLFQFMITHQSWWDTVDFIATKLVGSYFKIFPSKKEEIIFEWVDSDNIWLQRSALLFQLKYKQAFDPILLTKIISRLLDTNEFFIDKAIGWVLREYSRTNSNWVIDYVSNTSLSPLSQKEALRLLHQ